MQLALQTALAKHPSTLERAERWKLIAADVPGKSMKQCVGKFKLLREELLKSK
jgi:DnaJ family protein C protein 2